MKNDKLSRRKSSDEVSVNSRLPRRSKSEIHFLRDQASMARCAMKQTVSDMAKTLMRMVDLRSCTRRHPWLVTGSAVAMGFATGATLAPSQERKFEKLRAKSKAELQQLNNRQEVATATKPFMHTNLGLVLSGLLKALVLKLLAAAVVDREPVQTPSQDKPAEANVGEGDTE